MKHYPLQSTKEQTFFSEDPVLQIQLKDRRIIIRVRPSPPSLERQVKQEKQGARRLSVGRK